MDTVEGYDGAGADGGALAGGRKRWPGWPGDNVFRLLVPEAKVGVIIGRRGEYVKRICDETKARVKIVDPLPGIEERVVLISAKDELSLDVPPAVEAVLRVHRRAVEASSEEDITASRPEQGFQGNVFTRLLVPATQAGSLIGRQGAVIKGIQDTSTAHIRILATDDVPPCSLEDDRVVEMSGEYAVVHMALRLVCLHLRRFLCDHSVLPLFEHNVGRVRMPPYAGPAGMMPGMGAPPSSAPRGSMGMGMGMGMPLSAGPPQPAELEYPGPLSQHPHQSSMRAPPGSYAPLALGPGSGHGTSGLSSSGRRDGPEVYPPPGQRPHPDLYQPASGYQTASYQPQVQQGFAGTSEAAAGPGASPAGAVTSYGMQQSAAGAPPLASEPSSYDSTVLLRASVNKYGRDSASPQPQATPVTPVVTQVSATMQIPLSYAEAIIGAAGNNINFLRKTSGAAVTVTESVASGGQLEMTVEVRGSAPQVHTAQQLIEGFLKRFSGYPASACPRLELQGFMNSFSEYPASAAPGYTGGDAGRGGAYEPGRGAYEQVPGYQQDAQISALGGHASSRGKPGNAAFQGNQGYGSYPAGSGAAYRGY